MTGAKTRFIFVTGGVVSSLGKGIASATLGALLQARDYRVRLRKLDPYLNVDPGTMSPYQHGECFVTEDGAETDLDLGHYERFTGTPALRSDNITTGQIYRAVLKHERKGDYLGHTVQIIPHVTDIIKKFILFAEGEQSEDFLICEIGGTVGDIESLPFLEAIRQLANEVGHANVCFVHVTLLPYIKAAQELKTKPTQHSVKELLSVGIQPDILLCRAEHPIPNSERDKIALFCNVPPERVIPAIDLDSIYLAPSTYHQAGLDDQILNHFGLQSRRPNLKAWDKITRRLQSPESKVDIALVGKYADHADAYKSLSEALMHGGIANNVGVNIHHLESDTFEDKAYNLSELENCHAILVPGGFGERGAEGKIKAIRLARKKKIPFFGICFGMQMAVIEAARNLCGKLEAGTSEFGNPKEVLVGLLTEWVQENQSITRKADSDMGGTMRLGAYPCILKSKSKIAEIYGSAEISERHRHRYEVNIAYRNMLEEVGLIFSGLSPDGLLPETIELKDHPWFIGVQFHPELKSRPFAPHPLFKHFIAAALNQSRLL